MRRRLRSTLISVPFAGILLGAGSTAQVPDVSRVLSARDDLPRARLLPAPPLALPEHTDSNSPSVWVLDEGARRLFVFVSAGHPQRLAGITPRRFGQATPVVLKVPIPGGVWMEAVLPDEDALYGYYHQEPDEVGCGEGLTAPRIGSAVSYDHGLTWADLGVILDGRSAGIVCHTPNKYFAGGVGDFSVQLSPDRQWVYVLFTSYSPQPQHQGVSVARMPWADRDDPGGRVEVWSDGAWRMPVPLALGYQYPIATPVLADIGSWHDDTQLVRTYWGPSVHWNTSLEQYVMLLNRAGDVAWNQEGIYVSYNESLEEPLGWSEPVRLLEGGRWYPQVMGIGPPGFGTDREAGARARFYMSGKSEHLIEFTLPEDSMAPGAWAASSGSP